MADDTHEANPWAGVRAFRAAAARLGDPAPGLLAAVSLPEALVGSLMPALPLVAFSPFAELDVPRGEARSAPDVESGTGRSRLPTLRPGVRSAAAGPSPAGVAAQTATAFTPPPVFPLRQRRRPATGGVDPASLPGASAAPPRSVPGAAGTRATRSPGGVAEAEPRLLDDLTDSILDEAGPAADAGAGRQAHQFVPHSTRQAAPVASTPQGEESQTAPVASAPQGEGSRSAPVASAPQGEESEAAPAARPVSSPRRAGEGADRWPSGADQAPSILATIDALTDELLATPGKPPDGAGLQTAPGWGPSAPADRHRPEKAPAFEAEATGTPRGAQHGPDSAPPASAHLRQMRGPSAPSMERLVEDSSEPETAAEVADRSTPARHLPGEESGPELQSLDADTLALLVNEALAEQARRHGVDLS